MGFCVELGHVRNGFRREGGELERKAASALFSMRGGGEDVAGQNAMGGLRGVGAEFKCDKKGLKMGLI